MAAVAEIMQELRGLPRADRSLLARKLVESQESDEPFAAEELEMFRRCSREIRDSTVAPLNLESLQQDVRARLA